MGIFPGNAIPEIVIRKWPVAHYFFRRPLFRSQTALTGEPAAVLWLTMRCAMDDFAVFEEGMLERIGVTCARCGTTVIYDLSEELAVRQLTCSHCERVLLHVVDTGIDCDRRLPQEYSWLSLYKWLRNQAKENTIRFYFPRGHRRSREGPDEIFEELCSVAGAQLQR
jgi:hypothetical protein